MAISATVKTVNVAVGTIPLTLLTDGTNFFDTYSIYDPLSGQWAQVDNSGRLKVLGNIADPVTPAQIAGVDASGRLKVLGMIADPTTPAQIAAVDASGRLKILDAPAPEVGAGGAQYALAVGIAAVVTLTPPAGATHAWVTADPDATATRLRYTKDGTTTPTQAVGHTMEPGDTDLFSDLSHVKFIAEGTSGQTVPIQVSYVHF